MEGVSRIGELGKRLRMLAGRLVVRAGLLMMVVLSSLFFASYASAATIEIDNFTDGTGQTAICDPAQPGKCTLRAAISKANTTPGPHTIVIPDGTVELEQGVLEVKNSISIVGKSGDPAKAIIRNKPGAAKKKIFDINPLMDNAYTISLESVTISNGAATYANGDQYGGGGISAFINTAGMFTISNSVITGNSTTGDILYGGGLNVAGEAGGKLYIRNTVIQNNQAEKKGGGMFLEGDMDVEITHSSIDGNTARSGLGGGLAIEGMTNNLGSVLITGSTFSRNRADGTDSAFSGGGGIHLNRAATLTNTTLSGNTSAGKGAGLLVSNYAGTTTVNHATIYQNVANGDGGGIYLDKGSPIIHNSIVSGNMKAAAANDVAVSGSLAFATQSTNNLFGSGSGGLSTAGGNLLNVANPGLLGLQANGGFAETHALAPDSPARDKGNNAQSDLFDQRGFPRQTGSSVDIGAYEGLPDQSMQGNTTKTIVLAVGDEAKVTNVQASSPTSALLPNGSITVTGTGSSRSLAITPALNQTGTAVIMVQVDSETSGVKRTVTNSFTLTVTAPPLPDLTISKVHTGNFTQGQTGGQYRISVGNIGSVASSGTVTVSDAVPQGLTLKSLVGTGWTCSVTGSQCTRSDALGAGASYPDITVTVDVADSAPASLTNTATLSGGGDQNTTNNSASDLTTVIAKPTVTTESLPEATVNKSYQSAPLEVSGGQSPYSWAMAGGDLPTGLTLSASSVVSGTPTVANTFTFTVEVTDAKGVKATKGLTIKVNPELTVSTVSLPDGAVNVDYSQQLAAAGGNGSYTWAVTVGSLPNGLTLDASTGIITGKPTAAGTVPFTVEVTDGNNVKATVPLTMIVNPELIMNAPAVLPQGTVGAAYNEQTFTATGGNGAYVWSVEGNLPAGLTFDPATRKLAGTPTTAGVGRFTIKVVDGNGTSATKVYDLTVNPQLTIDTTSLKQGTVTKSYSETLTASGGNGTYTWTTVAGNLPDGLILNGAAITGVPTQAGPKTFTLQVTDGNGVMKTEEFTIQVNPELVMTAPTLPQGTVGTSYTDQIFTAAGGNGVYTWSVTGNFPAGLTFDAAQRKISGTPTTAGTFDFAVVVTDGNGVEAKKDYTVEINLALSIITQSLPEGTETTGYTKQVITAVGGNGVYTWTLEGNLPAGLQFGTELAGATTAATISGTPTAAGTNSFVVKVTDGNGVFNTKPISIMVNPKLTISTISLPDGAVNVDYVDKPYSASGGNGTYTWSIISGLPAGLTFDTVVQKITGRPSAEGNSTVQLRVTDGNGVATTENVTLKVNPELVIGTGALPDGTVSADYPAQIYTATGGSGSTYTWFVAGLPSGLTFDAASQQIKGKPATEGSSIVTVQVTDGAGITVKKNFTLKINPQLIITAPAFPQGTVGISYPDKTFTAAGGNGLYTWAFSGDLPAGLTFDIVQRKISGTPTEAGAFDFTVTVTDGNGVWVTQFIELQVNAALEIKTTTLKDATVGMSYSETLVASGGDGNYSWTKVSDDLPDGLVLAKVSNNVYAIAGIPTTKDAKTFTVRVTDGNGVTKDQQLTLQVNLPVLTSIQFKQSSYNVQAGQQQPTVLTGNYSDNSTSDITSGVTYQIDGAIASVDSSTGTVTGIKQGTTVLKATYGSQTALTTIIVDTQLSKLTLDAPSYQIELGQSKTAKVTAVYTDGAHQDVTANAIYAIDNQAIAEIDSHGVIRALRPGVAELSASYGGQTATATIIVNPAPQGPMTMSFGKATYDVSVGQSQATVVSVTYDGRTYPLTSGVVYHIGDSSIATVDANGTVYGKQSGQTVLTATYGSVQGTLLAHTVVLVGSDIKEIRFSQEQYSSRIGERTQAVVTAKLSDNSAVDVTGLTAYTVQNPSIASIGKDGVITAIQSGDTVITATYGGYSTTTRVVVYGRGGGGSGSSSGGSTPTPDNGVSVPIIIGDGKTETERISVEDIQKGVVVLNTASVSGTAELSAATISSLLSLNPELLVAFQTAAGTIEVPLATMDPQTLAKLLGIPAEGLKVQIGIREPNENEQQQFAAAMKEMGSTQLAKPLDFFINIVDGQGKLVNTDGFKNYIVRVLPLTAAADPNTATGVWWDPTSQQFRFVPTVFEMRDGQPVAKLKRQGLSFYTVLSSHIAFGDMASHWAKPTVETLASKLIIQGRSKDSFEPNGSITRAEWAALLVRALGLSDAKDKAPFSDMNGQWFAAAVNTAYKAKLIEGYDDGTFRPNQTVTREELAAMVMRAVSYVGAKPNDKQGQGVSFTDGADISTWATEAVKQAVQAGIIEGDSQGQFRPAQSASRAEAATMLYRLLKAVQFM
ncbi:putative Ig domain-containing protein [Paenibacillus sp. H1-7]|uniref:putative Ig domain-containing protein n=1 Tax=Paenibacillus sp. H1-7 TaxID=2282849 RepID=UPI001EF84FF6|nr:putative Ig domain-containing protein [Paenibacillus sp. H1-7]